MSFSILHIDDQHTWGGGQAQVLSLLKGLRDDSHRAELVTQPGSVLGKRAKDGGFKVHSMRMRGDADVFSARRISDIIRSDDFDIIHMHTGHAHMVGAMACAFNSSPACIVSKRVAFPINKGPLGIARLKYFWRIDVYVAVSDAVKNVLIAAGVRPSRIHVVNSGIVPPTVGSGLAVREEIGVGADQKLVGNIGALVEAKGQRYLLEAAPLILKEMPETRFVIIGDGKLESKLKDIAFRLGVSDAVCFAGFQEDIGRYLTAFDVLVVSSLMEGLNNSAIEAMMVGKPVVGTDVGGIPEIIEHGKTGLMVPCENHIALAEAVLDILNNPEKAAAFGSAGREVAYKKFTVERMVSGTIGVYEKVLKERCRI